MFPFCKVTEDEQETLLCVLCSLTAPSTDLWLESAANKIMILFFFLPLSLIKENVIFTFPSCVLQILALLDFFSSLNFDSY